jgi:hypothetical protein
MTSLQADLADLTTGLIRLDAKLDLPCQLQASSRRPATTGRTGDDHTPGLFPLVKALLRGLPRLNPALHTRPTHARPGETHEHQR